MYRWSLHVGGLALVALLAAAQPAAADWLLTPYLGVSFGGATDGQHVTYGGSATWMGASAIGVEIDGSYAPDLLEGSGEIAPKANAATLMANLIVGIPLGAPGLRPYVSGGAGLLRTSLSSDNDLFNVDDNSFGVNVGAGVIGFVRENVGLRGDVRYFRRVQDSDASDDIDLDLSGFDFWRATFGVTFRF